MRELSGRQIAGIAKITERHAAEFNALVQAVDACGDEDVRLDLTDLDATSLWKRDDFVKLAVRPNLTLILDPETAKILKSYLIVIGASAKFEERVQEVVPDEEDPRIQEAGSKFAEKAYVITKKGEKVYLNEFKDKTLPQNTIVKFDLRDMEFETLSSIGFTGQYARRAIEIIAQVASEKTCKLEIDFSDMIFEGGCDIVLADCLVDCRKAYNNIPVSIVGDDGIAEYVRVSGSVKLSAENKVRFFKLLAKGTVLRLCTYRSALRSDIAGRKGAGQLAHVALVIFRGLDELDVVYEEIPTQKLYLPQDLDAVGESENTGDIRIPRRRAIAELGIHRKCTGSHGHFGPVDAKEMYEVTGDDGNRVQLNEVEFVMRGFDALGLAYNKELLAAGKILTPPKDSKK